MKTSIALLLMAISLLLVALLGFVMAPQAKADPLPTVPQDVVDRVSQKLQQVIEDDFQRKLVGLQQHQWHTLCQAHKVCWAFNFDEEFKLSESKSCCPPKNKKPKPKPGPGASLSPAPSQLAPLYSSIQ